jgi:hypothetical protein
MFGVKILFRWVRTFRGEGRRGPTAMAPALVKVFCDDVNKFGGRNPIRPGDSFRAIGKACWRDE